MKINKNIKILFTAIVGSLFFCSCAEEENLNRIPFVTGEVENPVTISQVIIKDPNLSTFESILRLVEADKSSTSLELKLLSLLNLPGNNTVFLPSNEAFEVFKQENGISNLNALPIATLRSIVSNHVLSGTIKSSDFTTGFVTTNALSTAKKTLNLNMYVNTSNGVLLNNTSKIIEADKILTNGVVHVVDKVIPVPTVADFISFVPSLSGFKTTLEYTNNLFLTNGFNLFNLLDGDNTVTLFAPTNAAFTAALTDIDPTGATTSFTQLDQIEVGNLLRYHFILASNSTTSGIYSSGFSSATNSKFVMHLGSTTRVNFDGKAKNFTDVRGRVANISQEKGSFDIQASNGIIHFLDKVLLPTLPK